MEGNSEDLVVDSTNNRKIFEAVKRRKLESVLDLDTRESVESIAKQSTTLKLTKTNDAGVDCQCISVCIEVSPQEFAFSIDHVLEQIFSSLDLTSLLACRLVSRHWRFSSTHMILKVVNSRICFTYSTKYQVYVKERPRHDADAVPKYTLEDLTCFLKESYSSAGPFEMSEFPCNSLNFSNCFLSDPQLQKFLTTFGEYISTLLLEFSSSREGQGEATLIKHIGHLVNTQAPHLRTLHLFPSSKLGALEADEIDNAAVSSTNTSLSPQSQNDKGQEANKTNRKEKIGLLKLDYLGGQRKIFDYIISISPNLHEISLYCEDYHLLYSPLNRLHFLKEFEYDIVEDETFDFENFKSIEAALLCVSNEERKSHNLPLVRFRKLNIDFYSIPYSLSSNEYIKSCFVRLISKILELSWDTLESISLRNHNDDTLQGIKWPRVLPEVQKLDLRSEVGSGSGLKLFPSNWNFKIQETFPKLKRLMFDEVIDYHDNVPVASAGEFLRNCNFGPAANVKVVEVTIYLDFVPQGMDVTEDVNRFRSDVINSLVRLFPIAELTIKDEVMIL